MCIRDRVYAILDFVTVQANESSQGKNSIRVVIDQLSDINLSKNLIFEIKDVTHNSSPSSFQDKINKSFSFIFIDDYTLEILNSEDLYSALVAEGNDFDSYGSMFIINGMNSIKKFNQDSKLYRTLSVKEINNNEFEITGGEYNPAKFQAVDEIKHLRKPFLPIPPQADMEIPEAPQNLILLDLTYRGESSISSSSGSGATSGY